MGGLLCAPGATQPGLLLPQFRKGSMCSEGHCVCTPLRGEPLTVFSTEEQIFVSYKPKGRLECVGTPTLGHCHLRLHGEWQESRPLAAWPRSARRNRSNAPSVGGAGLGTWVPALRARAGGGGRPAQPPLPACPSIKPEVRWGGGPPTSGVPLLGLGEPLLGSSLPVCS